MQTSGALCRENRERRIQPSLRRREARSAMTQYPRGRSDRTDKPRRTGSPACAGDDSRWTLRKSLRHTGSAIEYFTWLSAKLDSIEAMPSSRVSLFFRNAS